MEYRHRGAHARTAEVLWRYLLPLVLVLAAGISLSTVMYRTAREWEYRRVEAEFRQDAERYTSMLNTIIVEHVADVASVAWFYKVTENMDRQKFRRFVQPILMWHNEIRAICWVKRVPDPEREEWEQGVSLEGFPETEIMEKDPAGRWVRASRRAEYYPIDYIEYANDLGGIPRFDLASEPVRRAALEHARDSGHLVFAKPVRSAFDSAGTSNILLLIPYYGTTTAPATTETRRQEIRGFVMGVLRIPDLIQSARGGWKTPGLRMCIFDAATSPGRLLYTHAAEKTPSPTESCPCYGAEFRFAQPFRVGEQNWQFVCTPTPGFGARNHTWQPTIILAAGLLLTAVLSSYILLLLLNTARVRATAGQLAHTTFNLEAEIIERQAAEERLTFQATLLDSVQEAVIAADVRGRIVYWGKGAEALYGYRSDEVLGRHAGEVFSLNAATAEDRFQEILKTGAHSARFRERRKDGTTFEGESHISLVRGENGAPCALIGIDRDVTERVRAEQELERRAQLLDAAVDLIGLLDMEGRYVYVNEAFCRELGYSREELLSMRLHDVIALEGLDERIQKIAQTGKKTFESIYRCRDGSLLPVEVHANVIGVNNQRLILSVARNITERKQLELQLRHAQKMDAIGRLAGGVAHDFNNLITAIVSYSELGRSITHSGEEAHRYYVEIRSAAERAANLTRQLLAFSRRQPLDPRVISLNEAVGAIEQMLRRLIGENIQLVTDLFHDLWPIRVDAGQIDQVIVNLAVNARDAMPDGGTLSLRTANLLLSSDDTGRIEGLAPGEYVLLTVSDTGVGMADEVKARLFEPFFTTKEQGRGTGLGLATCYGIVKQSGGHIRVDSSPGQGSTFRIYLRACHEAPCHEQPVAPEPPRPPSPAPHGNGTILVAEDDPSIRALASLILEGHGYKVLAAANGAEALEIAEHDGHAQRIDLLLVDLVMPMMSGEVLAARLRDDLPDLRVLFTSGYSEQPPIGPDSSIRDAAFLQKPFTPSELARKVHEVLSRS